MSLNKGSLPPAYERGPLYGEVTALYATRCIEIFGYGVSALSRKKSRHALLCEDTSEAARACSVQTNYGDVMPVQWPGKRGGRRAPGTALWSRIRAVAGGLLLVRPDRRPHTQSACMAASACS